MRLLWKIIGMLVLGGSLFGGYQVHQHVVSVRETDKVSAYLQKSGASKAWSDCAAGLLYASGYTDNQLNGMSQDQLAGLVAPCGYAR